MCLCSSTSSRLSSSVEDLCSLLSLSHTLYSTVVIINDLLSVITLKILCTYDTVPSTSCGLFPSCGIALSSYLNDSLTYIRRIEFTSINIVTLLLLQYISVLHHQSLVCHKFFPDNIPTLSFSPLSLIHHLSYHSIQPHTLLKDRMCPATHRDTPQLTLSVS